MLFIYVLFRNILSVLNVLLYILLIPPAIALCILNILFGKQRLRSAAEAGDADAQFRLGVCFMCGRGFARDAVHRDLPAVGGFQEIQAAQQRCFAGTGRADDRQRFALVQLQGDVAQHGGRAKALADAVYFQ